MDDIFTHNSYSNILHSPFQNIYINTNKTSGMVNTVA